MVTNPPTPADAIVLEIQIAATPDRVFQSLTDPRELAAWWDGRNVTWEIDLRIGGRWRSTGADDSCGEYEMWGVIVEFEAPRVLAYTWDDRTGKRNGIGQTTVRYELEAVAGGTRLRLTHSGFAAREYFEDYRGGWPGVLDRLRRHFV